MCSVKINPTEVLYYVNLSVTPTWLYQVSQKYTSYNFQTMLDYRTVQKLPGMVTNDFPMNTNIPLIPPFNFFNDTRYFLKYFESFYYSLHNCFWF